MEVGLIPMNQLFAMTLLPGTRDRYEKPDRRVILVSFTRYGVTPWSQKTP